MVDTIPGSPFRWKGTWRHDKIYEPADLVLVNDHAIGGFNMPGGLFVADTVTQPNGLPPGSVVPTPEAGTNLSKMGRIPAVLGTWTQLPNSLSVEVPRASGIGMAWRGTWEPQNTYTPGDVVRSGGVVFIAMRIIPAGSDRPTESDEWVRFSQPSSIPFRGDWSNGGTYHVGDIVVYNNNWYTPTQHGPRGNPSDATEWQLLAEFGTADALGYAAFAVSTATFAVGLGSGVYGFMQLKEHAATLKAAADDINIVAGRRAADVVRNSKIQPGSPNTP